MLKCQGKLLTFAGRDALKPTVAVYEDEWGGQYVFSEYLGRIVDHRDDGTFAAIDPNYPHINGQLLSCRPSLGFGGQPLRGQF